MKDLSFYVLIKNPNNGKVEPYNIMPIMKFMMAKSYLINFVSINICLNLLIILVNLW